MRTCAWVAGIAGAWVLMGALAGCGATAVPPAEEPKPPDEESTGRRRSGGPSFESEVGAMDEGKVKQTFEHLSGKLSACYDQGAQRVAYLAGEVRFAVRVAKDGSARFAFAEDSTLGDRETETCMLAVLKATAWPRPEGGEGMARNSFTFEPSGEERPPVPWSQEQLGPAFRKVKTAISQCRKNAGAKSIKVTMYVETDGKAAAVGVAASDEKGEGAASCVLDAVKGIKFPSPGSYAAKVSVTVE